MKLFVYLQKISFISDKIINYISFLCEAYILHKVNRYDIHGKRIFETNDKFYFEDNGIRNAIAGGTREGDIEKVIENIIYQNLIRLGYQVYVGLTASRTCIFASSWQKEYKNEPLLFPFAWQLPLRHPLHSNSIAHTVYSHFEPQKTLMTENDRDLNDRNSR